MKPAGAAAKNRHLLRESLDRLARFESELKTCEPAVASQLLSAWKEQIVDDLVSLLRATNDPDLISNVDRAMRFHKRSSIRNASSFVRKVRARSRTDFWPHRPRF